MSAKAKQDLTIPLLGMYPLEMCMYVYQKTHSKILIAWFVIAPKTGNKCINRID